MKNSLHINRKMERGGALTGIVVIIIILFLGAIYFYRMVKNEAAQNKTTRESSTTQPISNQLETKNIPPVAQ